MFPKEHDTAPFAVTGRARQRSVKPCI